MGATLFFWRGTLLGAVPFSTEQNFQTLLRHILIYWMGFFWMPWVVLQDGGRFLRLHFFSEEISRFSVKFPSCTGEALANAALLFQRIVKFKTRVCWWGATLFFWRGTLWGAVPFFNWAKLSNFTETHFNLLSGFFWTPWVVLQDRGGSSDFFRTFVGFRY